MATDTRGQIENGRFLVGASDPEAYFQLGEPIARGIPEDCVDKQTQHFTRAFNLEASIAGATSQLNDHFGYRK